LLPNGHVLVTYNDAMSPEGITTSILASMTANPTAGVTPIRVGDRVQLQAAASVTQGINPAPGLRLQGSALPPSLAPTDITFRIDMTDDQVALQVARAFDATFAVVN